MAKKFHKGNKLFLALGFTLIGAIEGAARLETSGERQNMTSGLEKVWGKMNELENQVVEIKTIIADAEKKDTFFDVQFNALEDRVRKVEVDEAKLQEDTLKGLPR